MDNAVIHTRSIRPYSSSRTRRYFPRLAVPSGTKAVYVGWNGVHDKSSSISQHPYEEELLLGRQIRYRINQVEEIKGLLVLHAEVTGQDV